MLPVTSSFSTTVYFKPSQVPNDVWDVLKAHEVDANCVLPVMIEELPNMIKELALEHSGAVPRGASQFWIVCRSGQVVELVLSCTNNAMGAYPIFIVALCQLSVNHLQSRIQVMAEKLLDASSLERVFSVFAPDDIASIFAQKWSRLTGVSILPEPYYATKLSYCTKDTFNRRGLTQNPAWDLRPASDEDLPGVAELCRQFAATSEPFILDEEGAFKEAQYLIQSTQVWVHTVSTTHYTDIASIVAFTRNSENNATLTKVFTNPEWRGYKCAQRLVARVCRELLFHQGKKSVAIFVAHDNGAASKVYHNVGFGGLYPSSHGLSSASGWTELGFDPAKVQLGHWSR
ncbi:hypothetical protein PM082_013297 [Marasmius tenuissimus]|nr:hypothetical protein PM082_013297 [Marasmius tenuissimus]